MYKLDNLEASRQHEPSKVPSRKLYRERELRLARLAHGNPAYVVPPLRINEVCTIHVCRYVQVPTVAVLGQAQASTWSSTA